MKPQSEPVNEAVSPQIKSRVETITPELAEQYLQVNVHNRPLNNKHVDRLTDQMKRGLWKVNGDSIAWDIEGKLVDGQHRLWACIYAGVPFTTLCVRGLPLDAFETKGVLQRLRSNADVFAIAGETNTFRLTASLQWLQKLRLDEMETSRVWPAKELMATLQLHPSIRDYVKAVPGAKWLPHSLFIALCYSFGRVDADLCQGFMAGLKGGFELGRPFNMLRERLLTNATNKAKLDHVYIAAITIKAWNGENAGKQMANLRWSNPPEKFPKIDGLKLR